MGGGEIINDISGILTLFRLMGKFGNVNHYMSISCKWKYDLNNKKRIRLVKGSVGLVFASLNDY